MNKKILVTLAVVLFVSAVLYMILTPRQTNDSLNENENVSREETVTVPVGEEEKDLKAEADTAETTVALFMDNFINAAPPESSEEAVNGALSLLSEGAKMGMQEDPGAGDLAQFMGVQDTPDEGYEVGDVVYKDNIASDLEDGLAEVEVLLKYSGGDTQRTFQLSKVDDYWQIDGVKLP